MAELVLQLKKINKYFGKNHVIKNVDLEFEKDTSSPFWDLPAAGRQRFSV